MRVRSLPVSGAVTAVAAAVIAGITLVVGVSAAGGAGASTPRPHVTTAAPRRVALVARPTGATTPATQSVSAGATVRFTSVATGGSRASEQWQVRDDAGGPWRPVTSAGPPSATAVRGASSPTLTLAGVATTDDGDQLRAVFSNAGGVTASRVASLFVTWNTGGTTPASTLVGNDGTATFSSTDAGSNPTPVEQWQSSRDGGVTWVPVRDGLRADGSTASGATSSVLTVSAVPYASSGEMVRATFTNSEGVVATPPATLTVAWNDGATAPISSSTVAGTTATYVSASTGAEPTPTEGWQLSTDQGLTWSPLRDGHQRDGSVVAGAATGTLRLENVQPDENGSDVRALDTNVAGTVSSSAAGLTVMYNLGGSTPANETVAVGSNAAFDSTGAGANPHAIERWQVSGDGGSTWSDVTPGTRANGSTVSSVTGVQLVIAAVASDEDLSEYRALFSNVAGTRATAPAVLVIPLLASTNWSGYVDTGASTFTSVAATWTVPTVTCADPTADEFSSQWVGIDGAADTTVEQDGVEADCLAGTPTYDAWYEMFGDNAVAQGNEVPLDPLAYPVVPGDSVTAAVSVVDSSWTLTVADISPGHADWSFTFVTTFAAAQSSAEWIVERPEECSQSACALTTLADFGSVTLTDATVQTTTSTGWISSQPDAALVMTDGFVDLDHTGLLSASGASFTVTWDRTG